MAFVTTCSFSSKASASWEMHQKCRPSIVYSQLSRSRAGLASPPEFWAACEEAVSRSGA